MVTQAAKELFALLNALGGGLIFVALGVYLLRGRPLRGAIIALLLAVIFICFFNALLIYFVI